MQEVSEEAKEAPKTQLSPQGIEEESKDSFVIVDNTYLDSVSEQHPLSNLSDFTRVNPATASTDFRHLNSPLSTFLIGPQFKTKQALQGANRNAASA